MRVKNHMAMWFLWFLWFLRVEYSANPLYKPLCAFLVFVDLLWFLCGSFCGFWIDCGFCGSVVLPSMPMQTIDSIDAHSTPCGFCGSVVLPSKPMLASGLARPLARMSCASSGFPYCQNAALGLQALARAPPLVVPTKRRGRASSAWRPCHSILIA